MITPYGMVATASRQAATQWFDLHHSVGRSPAGERIRCYLHLLWGDRGVIKALFNPMTLWKAQCAGRVTGSALTAGHFIPEEQPEATAEQLLGFFQA